MPRGKLFNFFLLTEEDSLSQTCEKGSAIPLKTTTM